MAKNTKKLAGSYFFGDPPQEILRAILRDGRELALEFMWEEYRYSLLLKSEDGVHFSGEHTCRAGGKIYKGSAAGELLKRTDSIWLIASWREENEDIQFVATLDELVDGE